MLAYDERRRVVVLHGGGRDETWELDGSTWTRCQQEATPGPRMRAAAAYDAERGRIVHFGGTRPMHADTWEYWNPHRATATPFGKGCPSASPPSLVAVSLPWIRGTFTVRLQRAPSGVQIVWLGFSKTDWGPFKLPLNLAPVGKPECNVLTAWDIPFVVASPSKGVSFPIPPSASLLGVTIYLQGQVFTADPFAGISNGLEATIGRRK